jgi:hypothetical protein
MRKDVKVATLSLVVLASACGTRKEQTATLPDDLQKDLAVASAPASDLATAPRSFQPTRFVSAMERSRTATPAKKLVATKRHTAPVRRPQPVTKPAESVADDAAVATNAEAPAPTRTPDPAPVATAPEPVVIAQQPAAEPAPVPVDNRGGEGDGGMGARRRGGGIGGLGGLLGGIFGGVIIRGGHGGVDKCDPRTDGRGRGGGITIGPDLGMPLPTGGTFPRRR